MLTSGRQPHIAKTYFTDVEGRPALDVESARNSLRGTLKSLQVRLLSSNHDFPEKLDNAYSHDVR